MPFVKRIHTADPSQTFSAKIDAKLMGVDITLTNFYFTQRLEPGIKLTQETGAVARPQYLKK